MIINECKQVNLKFLKDRSLKEEHEFIITIIYNDVKNVLIMFYKFRKNRVCSLYRCVRDFTRK